MKYNSNCLLSKLSLNAKHLLRKLNNITFAIFYTFYKSNNKQICKEVGYAL